MGLSASLRFESGRFDFTSEVPEEYNAGNRIHGRDVAAFLCGQLRAAGLACDFLDEDWGWLVTGRTTEDLTFLVAVYLLHDPAQPLRPGLGEWGLWVRAYGAGKWLGLVPRRVEVAVPPSLVEAVRAGVRAAGAEPLPWDDGPG